MYDRDFRVELEPIPVALIGAGTWGRNLLRDLQECSDARLALVCDHSAPARADAAVRCPRARLSDDYLDAVGDDEVRAVVVATQSASHHAVARAALAANKDVFVEKPLGLSVDEARDLCRAADAAGRILMVGHIMLYHPALAALSQLIAAGQLGQLIYVHAQRLNTPRRRSDDGVWWSLGPHDVAVANYLFRSSPLQVVGRASTGESPAAFLAQLNYSDGRLAHVEVSCVDASRTRRLTVVGTHGVAVLAESAVCCELTLLSSECTAPRTVLRIPLPFVDGDAPLRRECRAFLESIRTRRPPLSDGRSGLDVVRVLEAAVTSARAGGCVVALSGDAHG